MLKRTLIKDLEENKYVCIKGIIIGVQDFGKLIFLKIEDCTGIIQVILREKIKVSKGNFCSVEGKCMKKNDKLEIQAEKFSTTNVIEPEIEFTSEENKIKHRIPYIKYCLKENLILFSELKNMINNFFYEKGFINIFTPILSFPTNSGASLFQTENYFLSQSPQIYKQFLISAGIEKYFQLATCFRNEAQRYDRQPEFTQIDIEMSFVNQNDIQELSNELIDKICSFLNISYEMHYLKFDESWERFGTDAPFFHPNISLQENDHNFSFQISKEMQEIYPSILPKWKQFLDGFSCGFKIIQDEVFLLTKDRASAGNALKSFLRLTNLEKKIVFCWITDFYLFTKNNGQIESTHHPFSQPKEDILNLTLEEILLSKAQTFDLVLNGCEVGGGSIRINQKEVQEKIFDILNARDSFKNFMTFFDMPVPEHGGIAFGLERLLTELKFFSSIKEVIAFPKTTSGIGFLEDVKK